MGDIFIKRTDGQSTRSRPTSPIHHLLDHLRDLSLRLQQHEGHEKGLDLLERYDFFTRHSSRGRGCTYAHKCQQLFFLSDYEEVKQEILCVIECIRSLPGEEDFGR